MATIHKCDVCKKILTVEYVSVATKHLFSRYEFCEKCAAPILAILKKYKLVTKI